MQTNFNLNAYYEMLKYIFLLRREERIKYGKVQISTD